uniref:patatin-like phospholipase domain-containing protein 2 isoform X2 n=1 Tax=Myxine glutinosa TaxID=7769 RepID=UPI00358F6428
MSDTDPGWNISFAGCGFLGVYHIGVASCLRERASHLFEGASKIYGQCCSDIMQLAREARRRILGPMHPSFNIIKIIRAGLRRLLPEDAHERVFGKLCISLTRVSDGKNVLVSDFSSKEELIQVLLCSCFVPIYCGLIPPSFRGVRYVDGGLSDNVPQYALRNTIIVSPFSGESDICPQDPSSNFFEFLFKNTSIQCSLANLCRFSRALFPPDPQALGDLCEQGYNDALQYLHNNNLLVPPTSGTGLITSHIGPVCMEDTRSDLIEDDFLNAEMSSNYNSHQQQIQISSFEARLYHSLPHALQKALADALLENSGMLSQLLEMYPVRVASYAALPCTLPIESALSFTLRLLEWLPDVPDDMLWMTEQAQAVMAFMYRRARQALQRSNSQCELHRAASTPELCAATKPLNVYHTRHSVPALQTWERVVEANSKLKDCAAEDRQWGGDAAWFCTSFDTESTTSEQSIA